MSKSTSVDKTRTWTYLVRFLRRRLSTAGKDSNKQPSDEQVIQGTNYTDLQRSALDEGGYAELQHRTYDTIDEPRHAYVNTNLQD